MKLCRPLRVTAGSRANKVTDRRVNGDREQLFTVHSSHVRPMGIALSHSATWGEHKHFITFQCETENRVTVVMSVQ